MRLVYSALFLAASVVVAADVRAGETVACCLDGVCEDLSAEDCELLGGLAGEPDSDCASDGSYCETMTAPCCLLRSEGGGCLDLSPAECGAIGGLPGAVGELCQDAHYCERAPCCLPDGTCEVMDAPWCDVDGGVAGPNGATCEDVDCSEPPVGCRVTGGGNDGNMPPRSWAEGDDDNNQWTMGGQAGAPTADPPQPYGEWTHHQKNGSYGKFIFHAGTASAPKDTEIDFIVCSDPCNCDPARSAPAKQIHFGGVGSFKNGTKPAGDDGGDNLNWFTVYIADLGEPGNKNLTDEDDPAKCPQDGHESSPDGAAKCECADFYRIQIHADRTAGSAVIYEVDGYLHGGNFQIHPAVGETFDGSGCP